MKLINADSVINAKFPIVPEGISEVYVKGWNDAIDAIVDNAPTVERPKGAWECGGFCFSTTSYRCPFCKTKTLERTKFCPNCGADMRGGQDNDPN